MDPFALNLIMIIGFVVGTGLIIVEAFIPGFGIAGISGIILEVVAIFCCGRLHGTGTALLALAGVLLLIGAAVFLSYRSAQNGRLSKSNLVLKTTEEATEEKPSAEQWLNKEGITVTALRPGGTVEAEGTRLNAASAGDFIERGAAVVITGAEGDHLIVRRKA